MRAAMASRSSLHPVIGDDGGAEGARALDLGPRRIGRHHDQSRACRRSAPPPPRPGRDCRTRKPPRHCRARSRGIMASRLQAPRNLKEPVRCRVSSFRNTRAPISRIQHPAFHQRRADGVRLDAIGGGLDVGEGRDHGLVDIPDPLDPVNGHMHFAAARIVEAAEPRLSGSRRPAVPPAAPGNGPRSPSSTSARPP